MVRTSTRIAAIIPTYNRAPLLGRAIESVLDQTYPAAEVIVIDDGSRDDTSAVAAKFGTAIRYVRQENAGASEARNNGVRLASTEWVAFLDSDDVWVPTHLERMAAAIEGTKGCAPVYFADMEQAPEDGGGSLWESIGFHVHPPYEVLEDASECVMMDRQPTMLQCSVFRKAEYEKVGGLWKPLWLTHDTHLFLKLCLGGPACAVAGHGSVQTSDAATGGTRLTLTHGQSNRSYWIETRLMWKDVLECARARSPKSVPRVRELYANANWRLARFDWNSGKKATAFVDVMRVFRSQPAFLLSKAKGLQRR